MTTQLLREQKMQVRMEVSYLLLSSPFHSLPQRIAHLQMPHHPLMSPPILT